MKIQHPEQPVSLPGVAYQMSDSAVLSFLDTQLLRLILFWLHHHYYIYTAIAGPSGELARFLIEPYAYHI